MNRSKGQQNLFPLALTSEEAAYIAGFLDGEGHISIRRSNRYTKKYVSYRLCIGFTNRDLSVLRWLHDRLGGGIYAKVRAKTKHAAAFELILWNVQSNRLLLEAIKPYIRIKKAQLQLGLDFIALGKIKNIMVENRGKRWPRFAAAPGEFEEREAFKQKLSLLNKRGA